ncbi:HAMP domain-containing protein [Actinomadura sp. HBU206391]|uniref:HAMP domain-containing sensor histidine kinase n=1 Tax=Actinomadura sp. HBU206391 TaxID=2731692 RepID=UPI00165085F2|nr:HAMP domain-containing protein [Actinomadura sp. HBU206391]MBC6458627.1 HAMP domain-containing protein [Actinomadura sp. HBU206391]
MFARFGLRSRMAASYMVVSAAAVLLVEGVLLTLVAPQMRAASEEAAEADDRAAHAADDAALAKTRGGTAEDATRLGEIATSLAHRRKWRSDEVLLAAAVEQGFADFAVVQEAKRRKFPDGPWEAIEAVATPDGRVVASTTPKVLPIGSALPAGTVGSSLRTGRGESGQWATRPVMITTGPNTGARVIGVVHLRLPLEKPRKETKGVAAEDTVKTDQSGRKPAVKSTGPVEGLLMPGLIVLVLLLPVGLLFGLLSTGRLIRRIRRLAESTVTMADGDLQTRVPVTGGDEVGRLEEGFNWMAERLESAVRLERDTAGAEARRAERSRIARELHDSVSQDLFSLSLLAGGMRRALPAESALRRQAESMERTVDRTMREMRAMLLELRPVTLDDAGLVAALGELCRSYEARLGIRISADIGELQVEPAVELAVLRVAQEALGNAARHGAAKVIELSVAEVEGHVVMAISDQGRGFDPAQVGERHGMGLELMRERVTELGGTFDVASAPRCGTTVRVRIPGGVS